MARRIGEEALWEGAILMTPFGRAIIRKIDLPRDRIVTDLGTWDMQQVFRREAPEEDRHRTPEEHASAMQAWLEGPAYEVRGVVDIETKPCPCSGTGMSACCQTQVHIHKRSRLVVHTRHEPLGGCRCAQEVECSCLRTKTS